MSESTSRLVIEIDSKKAERLLELLDNKLVKTEKSGISAAASIAGIGVALVGAFVTGKMAKVVMGFEDSMLRLKATSNATAKEMSGLSKQARELGATSRYSAQQTAEAQNFLAMAGFKVNEVFSATPQILKFASAAGLELGRSADIASNVLGGLSLAVSELPRVMDVMALTAQSANTSIEQLGEAMSFAAPLAVTAGIEVETLSAAIGVLGDSGIQAGRAGTGLLGFVRQLADVTPQAEQALFEYGLVVDDVNIKQRGLTAVAKTLGDAHISTANAIRIFGAQSAAASLIIAGNADRLKELDEANDKAAGTINRVADLLDSSLSTAFLSVASATEEAMLQMGERGGFSSVIKVAAVSVGALISEMNGMLPQFAAANNMSLEFTGRITLLSNAIKAAAIAIGVGYVSSLVAAIPVTFGLSSAIASLAAVAKSAALILSGPVGIALAVGAAALAIMHFSGDTAEAKRSLENLKKPLQEATREFQELTLAAQFAGIASAELGMETAAKKMRDGLQTISQDIQDSTVGWLGIFGRANEANAAALGEFKQATNDALQGIIVDWDALALKVVNNTEISDKNKKMMIDAAAEMQRLGSQVTSSGDYFNALNEILGRTVAEFNAVGAAGKNAGSGIRDVDSATTDFIAKLYAEEQAAKKAGMSAVDLAHAHIAANKAMNDGKGIGAEAIKLLMQQAVATDKANAAKKKSTAGTKKHTAAIKKEITELEKLIEKYGDTAFDKYNKKMDELTKGYDSGKITLEKYTIATKNLMEEFGKKEADEYAAKIEKLTDEYKSLTDRLFPAAAAAKQLSDETDKLNKMVSLGILEYEDMQYALMALEREYKQNQIAASEWGQMTQRGIDSVDQSFADMWLNIGDGFNSFADSLKDAFKNMLAELAHMAITRPIIMNIGAALMGGGAGGGVAAILGGGGGASGGMGSIAQMGSSIYSAFTGWGKAAYTGFQSGGFGGAMSSIGSHFGVGGGASGATGAGFGLNSPLVTGGIGNAGYAGGGGMFSGLTGAIKSAAPMFAGLTGALMGFKNSGLKGGIAGGAGGFLGAKGGAALGSLAGPVGTAVGAIVGGALGAFGGSKLFGGKWKTKDTGIGLAASEGEFGLYDYQYKKKKGGLFSSNKKKTSYQRQSGEDADAFGDVFNETRDFVTEVYESLGIAVDKGALAGVNIAMTKISTAGKTEEEINQAVTDWFAVAADKMSDALKSSAGVEFNYTLEEMAGMAIDLNQVNDALELLKLGMFETSVAGAELAQSLNALFGGEISAGVANYYSAFYSADEQMQTMLTGMRGSFQNLNKEVPQSRAAFRDLVESLDYTTEAGMETFAAMMNMSDGMSQYYGALEQLELNYYAKFTPLAEQNQNAISGLLAEFSNLGITMPKSRNDFVDLVDSVAITSDASVDLRRALLSLAPAMDEYYKSIEKGNSALAFAGDKMKAEQSMVDNIGQLRESIFMDQLDDRGRYDYAKTQADALSELLPNLTDLKTIMDTTAEITRLTQAAYGQLDESGQKTNAAELIKFLDDTQAAAQEKIKEAQIEQTERQAKIMSDAMMLAGERMADVIERGMLSGANAQAGAAAMFESIANQLANNMAAAAMRTASEVN